ncbi:hypothetical protein SPRG_19425 [Saprolegnia parasitica CBS 223.65]|uniref:CYRIA/CYRIB Rac1 binding domain-containing protein n=1 Tax=Saprolegnia parasitica (strain CBS 223.65) TaxID=695850 RepID=A0A067D192_SAPPC|nr:hypothetical protein SPRG_19425 [Saprolegnia parasitica CBS 223.65]KDO32802.1 hypothetical protein SPRG_19425 [Saprolegnia parasitica CBS 223.65]|eukprot:XP_012196659.1 hypothetical protein SPRG_19425 [Saprolegnia parasitica CBS 223.65]
MGNVHASKTTKAKLLLLPDDEAPTRTSTDDVAEGLMLQLQAYEAELPNQASEPSLEANIALLHKVYLVAMHHGAILPQLLLALAPPETTSANQREQLQRVADICIFALAFDNFKAMTPRVQNDVSLYRRHLASSAKRENAMHEISETQVNALSLFLGEHMPAIKLLGRAIADTLLHHPDAATALASVAHAAYATLSTKSASLDAAQAFYCMRAMAATILVLDHSLAQGVFAASSPLKIKRCLRALVDGRKTLPACTQLLDAIKFASRHGNDSSTPRHIRLMLHK